MDQQIFVVCSCFQTDRQTDRALSACDKIDEVAQALTESNNVLFYSATKSSKSQLRPISTKPLHLNLCPNPLQPQTVSCHALTAYFNHSAPVQGHDITSGLQNPTAAMICLISLGSCGRISVHRWPVVSGRNPHDAVHVYCDIAVTNFQCNTPLSPAKASNKFAWQLQRAVSTH